MNVTELSHAETHRKDSTHERSPMIVSELGIDEPGKEWDAYVAAHPKSTLFHTLAWRDLITRHFRHRPRYLVARDRGRVRGVLPLFETRSILSGRALCSVPYAVYGGPLAEGDEAERALLERARELVDEDRYRFAELRCLEAPGLELPGSELYHTFVKDLPDDPEACLASIPRKSRATARQGRDKHGLRLVEDPALIGEFHRLFVVNKQKLGSPSFSRRWFEDVLNLPENAARLHGVYQGDRLLLAVISFQHGGCFSPYYSGAEFEADRVGAANFVYWKLMEVAVESGARRFDFGRSRAETGAFRFKRNMGFEPTGLAYRWILGAGRELPHVNPSNPKFSLPRRLLQRMPRRMVEIVGPFLMKSLP